MTPGLIERLEAAEGEHTPGPWFSGWNGGLTGPTTPTIGGPCCGGKDWGFQPVAAGMNTVAICPNATRGVDADEPALANARLIAAAPDLLECLTTVRDYVTDAIQNADDPSVHVGLSMRTMMAEDLARIDAAILKARATQEPETLSRTKANRGGVDV